MAAMCARLLSSALKKTSRFAKSSCLSRDFKPQTLGPHRLLSIAANLNAERKFTDKHEWVSVEGITGTVGISQYAQDSLGDVVYIQLPEVGAEYTIDDECGALESVKAASEIYCPVSGKVIDVNSSVSEKPSLVNTSCYNEGWLFKIELANEAELKDLMNEAQYEKFLEENN